MFACTAIILLCLQVLKCIICHPYFHQDGYLYSRWGNPTVDAAASVITSLEGAAGTLLFSSGMSAIVTTLFTFLRAGDHAVICRPCYGGLNAFVEDYLRHLGVEVTWVATSNLQAYKDAVRENTKVKNCTVSPLSQARVCSAVVY